MEAARSDNKDLKKNCCSVRGMINWKLLFLQLGFSGESTHVKI